MKLDVLDRLPVYKPSHSYALVIITVHFTSFKKNFILAFAGLRINMEGESCSFSCLPGTATLEESKPSSSLSPLTSQQYGWVRKPITMVVNQNDASKRKEYADTGARLDHECSKYNHDLTSGLGPSSNHLHKGWRLYIFTINDYWVQNCSPCVQASPYQTVLPYCLSRLHQNESWYQNTVFKNQLPLSLVLKSFSFPLCCSSSCSETILRY